MTGKGRLRLPALAIAALVLVVTVGAGLGTHGPDVDQFRGRLHAVVSSGDAIGSGAGPALDTRLQRDTELRPGQRTSRHDGLSGQASFRQAPGPWSPTLAAILERASHPERVGHILLRGPPGPSA
jgi:hypothetical protein